MTTPDEIPTVKLQNVEGFVGPSGMADHLDRDIVEVVLITANGTFYVEDLKGEDE